jgi:hypothetical protein
VWCETLPFEQLPAAIPLLARYQVDLLLAVRPWQLAEIATVVERVRGAGVFVGLWPMLADEDGRWANARSCGKFIAFTDALLAQVPAVDELVIDLEPPFAQLARWVRGRPARMQASHYRAARDAYAAATRRWHATHRITTAIMPMLAFEFAGQWMQRVLGTPTSALVVDRHSVMAYTSLFEGWSRGVVDRRRAEQLLVACARFGRRRFGERAAMSLGCVGAGAFGVEPSYRDASELARDVAIARRAGIEELALFDLGGVMRRLPAEAWFEAFAG